jgi:2-polyprenyl-3-methyl-5-hydroxy-6-metoxy-1,4-benzoquinol methylase
VLEHVADRDAFLAMLEKYLSPGGRMIITTPHPVSGPVHGAGSRMGLFSREAGEEHESLIGAGEMKRLARRAGFALAVRRRFLLGMNQLFVLARA